MNPTIDLDDKIRNMLDRVDQATPTPPAFADLRHFGQRAPSRVVPFTAAAAVVALGVGGLVAANARGDSSAFQPAAPPEAPQSADSQPAPATTLASTSTIGNVTDPSPAAHLPPGELFVAAALAPDQTEVESYDRAVAAHRSACMADAGFTEAPELAPVAVSADSYIPIVDFLYFDDPAKIAQYGYYWPDRFGTSVETTGQQSTVTPEVSAALDRCNQPVIAIQQQAYRENNLGDVVADMIDGQIFDRVNSRPEVEEKYTDWKMCMSAAGYPTARLRESVTADYSPTIDQATTDASCRRTTGYTNAVVAAQADEVATWLASNHDTVEAFKQLWIDLAAGAAQLN